MGQRMRDFWLLGEGGLLEDLSQLEGHDPISAEDEILLPLMVSTALEGIDIAKHYHHFYRRMLASPALQEAFLEALRSLEDRQPPAGFGLFKEHLPESDLLAGRSLGYKPTSGGWLAAWRLGVDQLQAIFFPSPGIPAAAQAYRSDDLWLEDLTIEILRELDETTGLQIDLLFQAIQKLESPDLIHPEVQVAIQSTDTAEPQDPSGWRLHLRWGDYQASSELDARGRASFPPLQRQVILDEIGEQITSGLTLSLEPRPA